MSSLSAHEIRLIRDSREREAAMALRYEVFCQEQGVSRAQEADGRDGEALHLVALEGERVVGTCRLLIEGATAKVGRMAVERPARGRGLGLRLLRAAEREARAAGARRVALHAQTYAAPLYERGGFIPYGKPFIQAGIEHVAMEKDLV
jgi:ElaA protein